MTQSTLVEFGSDLCQQELLWELVGIAFKDKAE
jgi:hypothetical protein